jgi:hypothetical protein
LIWNTSTSAINQYNGSAWEATDTNTQADITGKLNLSGGTMTGTIAGFTSTGIDDNATSTAVTIDTSENVLVGKTTTDFGTEGIVLFHSNDTNKSRLHVTSDSTSGGYFNRLGNDGEAIRLYRQGNLVGGVGVTSTGAYITLGGTGAANTLDDYEEGNYTVAITMGTGTAAVASSSNKLSYTKVGRLVTIGGQFQVGSVSSPGGELQISLPFACETNTSGSNHFHVGTYRTYLIDTPNDGTHPVIYTNPGSSAATLQWARDAAGSTNERATSGGYFMIGLTYMAA